ncbi:uncharacterized protein LOC121853643 isoform X2 [Homarus americanus]|uniref:uncharacterized protein LOC121853643 isoform X2 n=1 Tax=Homarus americanus TaxID=6706 RepID=UPI001C460C48|nr:uncharacterized protein LOC121853643 isoform X2 [Homarus americanus]
MRWTDAVAWCLLVINFAGVSRGCHIYSGNLDDRWWQEEQEEGSHGGRVVREVTLGERSFCDTHDELRNQPPNRANTSDRVAQLRAQMLKLGFDAYIIPNDDEHQSEYVSPTDERRSYISGFSGSAGTAVVTMDQQALWTDGRYFLQADQQLDCHWLLMKQKNPGVPKMMEWLRQKLVKGSKVGADPRLLGSNTWIAYAEDLAKSEIKLEAEERNLVDLVWPAEERPPHSQDPIFIHELKFAGKKWEDKVADVRAEMLKEGADLLVVTALDEVAWLLNLRGNDIPYNPVFRSYLILGRDDLQLYIPKEKITPAVDHHLHVNSCEGQECVVINEYTAVLDRLRALKLNNHVKKVMLGSKYSYSGGASYAVYSAVPEEMRLMVTSPVLLMKARKNAVEVDGMKNAHIKDAVALCDFLSFMEPEIMEGKNWSEIDAANLLKEYRSQQRDFKGISFTTISAFGSNGAIVHYQPVRETDKKITNTSLYLLDSGGQYKDGTTDVTRTMHYGDPKPLHVEAYTRVLMGAIDLATLIFPEGTGDADVDIMARRHLYEVGLDYRHGTGHGIGMFLNVHEAFEKKYRVNFYGSHEPGFYLDNDFGVRLETIVTVVPKDTPYHFDKRSLGFEAVTLVPFEPKLINITMLTGKQCHWLNSYHARVRDVVGGELMTQGRTRGYEWLISKTEPLPCVNHYGGTLESAGLMSSTNLQHVERVAREAALDGRTNCKEGNPQPEIRVNTSSQMTKLRQEMGNHRLDGYIIPMTGEQHGYLAPAEKRLQYMTGFTGSFGNVAVTADEQALWTDGRYFLQADSELGCDWLLMKEQIDGVPTISEWLRSKLVSGAKVGADPRLIAADTWKFYSEELAKSDIELVAEETNLVDLVWPAEERPPYSQDPIYIHELQFAGKRWEDKVADVRAEMERQGADILVITAPDEVAWLLNLRGSDVETTPVFRSYVIIGRNNVELFVPPDKITPAVDNHLNVNQCGEQECVIITEYIAILDRLRVLKLNNGITKVMLGKKYSYSGGASYAIYSAVPEEKRLVTISPVLEMKARKNPVEIKGMKDSHIRDAVALCDFLSFMEKEINSGNSWNEITASEKLLELRRQQQNFMGVSFKTISAFGPNGAVIHYRPRPDTNREITTESLYLLDSGGQYKDGTTDVTRTMHYGEPTSFQVEAYTRVLIGAIDLARLIFPEGTDDTDIDILARRPLYEVGLDYRHGTGHGIGHFLGVHEAPIQVRIYSTEEHKLEVGHFFSDEPGYYQDNQWGIRLETILTVVTKETEYKFDKQSLGFEPVTLVPFEAKLINTTLLEDIQCDWLNDYHTRVREVIGPELLNQGHQVAYDWLVTKTEPLKCPHHRQSSPVSSKTTTTTTTSVTTTGHHLTTTRTVEYATSAIITHKDAEELEESGTAALASTAGTVAIMVLLTVKNLLVW